MAIWRAKPNIKGSSKLQLMLQCRSTDGIDMSIRCNCLPAGSASIAENPMLYVVLLVSRSLETPSCQQTVLYFVFSHQQFLLTPSQHLLRTVKLEYLFFYSWHLMMSHKKPHCQLYYFLKTSLCE